MLLQKNGLYSHGLFLAALTIAIGVASAQPVVSLPTTEQDYFRYVFTSIADPDKPSEERELRLRMYVERMNLDPNETAALARAVAAFRPSLVSFRLQANSLFMSRPHGEGLDATGDANLRNLRRSHDEATRRVGAGFLSALRPATVHRIRMAMQGGSKASGVSQ